jgi:hypothetical protein
VVPSGVPSVPPRDSHWFLTTRAINDYAALARLDDLERAWTELAQLSARAHLVRRQGNGIELWRVKAFDGQRLRLLVGEPAARFPGAKPALVQVLGEFTRGPKTAR